VILFSIIIAKTGKLSEKTHSVMLLLGFAVEAAAIIASIIDNNGFIGMSFAVGAADILMALPYVLFHVVKNERLKSLSEQYKKWISRMFAGTAVVLLAEVFLCNFGAYNLILPNSPSKVVLPLSYANVNDSPWDSDVVGIEADSSATISFGDINYEVKNIYVDIESSNVPGGTINILHNDETTKKLKNVTQINYINGNELSKYAVCSYFGDVEELRFNVSADEESDVIISGITLNKPIPFEFSWLRFFIILGFVLFVVTIACCPFMKKSCGKSKTFGFSSAAVTVVFAAVVVLLFAMRGTSISELIKNPDKNQINAELVDAFEAGQVSLLQEPEQDILSLENPYDWSARTEIEANYLWDHLLFEGKYYSYYGIGTVLTLFLPYHLITGNYFPSHLAVLIYAIIGVIFLTLAYCTFMKRLFPKIPNSVAVSGLVIVQATSFIWYCVGIVNFYELAQISGFTFLIVGMFFLLRSGVVGEGKISRPNICIATILMSIAVLCRAALALYCIVALLFVYAGVKKIIRSSQTPTLKANKKPVITFLLAAMLPFALIGSVQMIYNYLRFGSILDFGIQYTLTIYDYQHIQFHLPLALIAIYNYLFTVPNVSTEFPFITSNYESLGVNGYYFLAGYSACGLIFRSVPILGYVFGRKAYKKSDSSNRRLGAAIIILGGLAVPLIQMFMIWEYGYTQRYAVDFAWEMLFGAFAILFVLYGKISKVSRNIIGKVFTASAVISVIVNFALVYESYITNGDIPVDIQSKMLSLGRLFEFWNII
jgi:hypothetical protein